MLLIKDIAQKFKQLHKQTFIILKIGIILSLILCIMAKIIFFLPNVNLLQATLFYYDALDIAPGIFLASSILAFIYEAVSRDKN